MTLAIGFNAGGGALSGTTSQVAVAGVATFTTLSIDAAGNGYTLVASVAGLSSATSSVFTVFAEAGPPAKLAFTEAPVERDARGRRSA